ncbi:uncharacterized protein LOC123531094 [Mercenaria mercenaria]|uniref:uncharacterized protein LOC123531094 n=1 Tax=Mercenaria mercenaria TaxID=6596 RepID=UPI00234EB3C8|nr:uncharacterized protein LOC123531094 [Mercenaria mercenaria]
MGSNCEQIDCSSPLYCHNGGTCNSINGGAGYACSCADGWMGSNCEQIDCSSPLYCHNGGTCHSINGGTGYTCSCANGWMGPNCEQIDCSSPLYCHNGGTCNSINGGAGYTCSCADGWMGSNCEQIDCSSPLYCHNGGTCHSINGGTGYTCSCADGWMGPNCEQIDCSSPLYCHNGGTCNVINGGTGYSCSCADGWMGSNCELIDCSSPLYCHNGGTCHSINGGTGYTCSCANGWMGPNCEQIDCSSPLYCHNGGTCNSINGGAGYTCSCADGWMGSNCEQIDCSSPLYCHNGGTCNVINGGTGYSCSCADGWMGSNCELIDCSSPLYCHNGGTCNLINGGTGYSCSCADGWMGSNCQLIDCSSPLYCHNGGTCNLVNSGTGYTCSCANGWMGSNCELIDCSSPLYCHNGGTCNLINGGAGYTCSCANGWMGSNCELIDCSSAKYCLNGGTCFHINGGYDYMCSCSYGWTGSNCENIDVCTPYTDADIAFVVDVSESEGNETFEEQKEFMKNFISKFPVGPLDYRYQFSAVTFSSEPIVHFYLNDYQDNDTLLAAVDAIEMKNEGPSFTGKALQKVKDDVFSTSKGARSSVERYVIVLTDGLSSDPSDTKLQAAYLKSIGVRIYAIAVGRFVNHEELLDIATYPRHVFPMYTSDALQNLLKYTMFGCSNCTNEVSDVAIVMDVSPTIGATNFETQMQAAAHLIKQSNVGSDAIQFSYTTFSEQYKTIFQFDQFDNGPALISKINTGTKVAVNSNTDVYNILTHLSSEGFSVSKGARLKSRKVVIIFSPGNVADLTLVKSESQRLKDSGHLLITVGAGLAANITNLVEISSNSAFTYILGDDVYQDIRILDSLQSVLEYSYCTHVCIEWKITFIGCHIQYAINRSVRLICGDTPFFSTRWFPDESIKIVHYYFYVFKEGSEMLALFLYIGVVNFLAVKGGGPHYCESPARDPCQNGGTCNRYNSGYTYTCSCWAGYTGRHCEQIDVCYPYRDADIVFVVDTSESEGNETFEKQKSFIKSFTSKFPVGPYSYRYQFSVVTYSLEPVVHFYLGDYQDNNTIIAAAVDAIEVNVGGPSFTGKALKTVNDNVFDPAVGARSSVEHYVIVLTDGHSSDPTDTILQAAYLKSNGVKIYAIAVGSSVNHEELLEIATYPKHVFTMYTSDALQNLLKYTMFGCSDCTNEVADVAIAMDITSSIGVKNFNTQIQAVAYLIKQSNVSADAVQFSYTTFSEHYQTISDFNHFDNGPELISMINTKTRMKLNSNSNVSSILEYLSSDGFSVIKGTRPHSRKVAVIFSSGNVEDLTLVKSQSKKLKDSGHLVVTIGVGLSANATNLVEISSDPALTFILGDDVFQDIRNLDALLSILEYSFCSHICEKGGNNPCVQGDCTSNDNGHAHYQCSCYAGWTGYNCDQIDCSSPLYCHNGGTCYLINGRTDYRCGCADGWRGSNCDQIDCSSSRYCRNGGTCILNNGGTSYRCNCANGWMGSNCEKVDCSSPIYCRNGGTCNLINSGRGKTCSCTDGWTGPNCEQIDCSSSRYCHNGGTCNLINGGKSYRCNCADGWTGSNCEKVDCSSPLYCHNGGTCKTSNGGTKHTCTCADGWMGPNCEHVDCSSPLYCHNGGTCNLINGGKGYACRCAGGWMGSNCERTDCSSPLYCRNGGTCNLINGGKGHTCSCADGWRGSNCDLTDCSSPLYCHNGGTCNLINGGKGHTCSCADGWMGSNCDLTDCSSPLYCHNGGTCNLINGGKRHTCSCADGWMGSNCDLTDCSSPLYCHNGGTCNLINGGKGHTCSCADGWMGSDCDLTDCSSPLYCHNGGTCNLINAGKGHTCSCADGWKGSNCDLIDCSSPLYCHNGGTCSLINGGKRYSCSCADGWRGPNCDLIDCSSPLYCHNGGTCNLINGGKRYTCSCTDGWKGTNCDVIDCSSPKYCLNGGTCLHINSGHDYMCSCSYGWTGSNCEDIDVCTPYTDADIAFVVDVSESEGSETFEEQKEFMKNFISKFPVGPLNYRYQFSVMTFSLEPVVHFYLNDHQDNDTLLAAVDAIKVTNGGPSFTGKALQTVKDSVFDPAVGVRSSVEHYVIVLTDGLSSDPTDTKLQAAYLKSNGVKIYAIAIGRSVNHEELLGIATYPKHVFPMYTSDALQNLLKYTMFGCSNCTNEVSDVAIVMDVTSSIGVKNFDTQLQAAAHLIKHSNVGPNATMFSYTTFSEQYQAISNFNQFDNAPALLSTINANTKMKLNSYSNVSSILEYLSSDGFSVGKGTRQHSRKIVVVITPGNAEDLALAKSQSKRLKDSGHFVVTIGVGLAANVTNLVEISSDPALTFILGDDVYQDIRNLDALQSSMEYSFCTHI